MPKWRRFTLCFCSYSSNTSSPSLTCEHQKPCSAPQLPSPNVSFSTPKTPLWQFSSALMSHFSYPSARRGSFWKFPSRTWWVKNFAAAARQEISLNLLSFENRQPDRYQKVADTLNNRFGEATSQVPIGIRIPIKMVTVPDITDLMTLPRLATFSNFVPMHRQLGSRLLSILMGEELFALKNNQSFVHIIFLI